MSDLNDLLARVKAATGPDEELDASICVALSYGGPNSVGAKNVRTDPDWEGDLIFEVGRDECCNPIPELTASLDAALALVEWALPGWSWTGGNIQRDDNKGGCWGILYDVRGGRSAPTAEGMFASVPLALLAALLSERIASSETKQGLAPK